MGFNEILSGIAMFFFPWAIAWGMQKMSRPGQANVAIFLFAIAPTPLVLMDIWYVINTADSFQKRAFVSVVVGALALVSTFEQIRAAITEKC